MTVETIVAVYDTAAHADAAVRDLQVANVPSSAISRHTGEATTLSSGGTPSGSTPSGSAGPVREKGFWSNLFGGEPDHDESVYDRTLNSGSSVVTVKVDSEHVQRVTAILEQHGPVDMDERAASYSTATTTTQTTTGLGAAPVRATGTQATGTQATGTQATGAQATAVQVGNEQVLALSEEQLTVGKRLVNHGTTRIRRFVVETPVEEAVTLHSERVSIERRPVAAGTKVTDADFTDRVIEVTETDEEAVVAKTARVTEELVINKEATERVETVRDTVRREDVEITREGPEATTTSTTQPLTPKAEPRI